MNDADKKLLALAEKMLIPQHAIGPRHKKLDVIALASAVPRLIAEKEALLRLLRRCCERFSPHELLREHIENALAADDAAAKDETNDKS